MAGHQGVDVGFDKVAESGRLLVLDLLVFFAALLQLMVGVVVGSFGCGGVALQGSEGFPIFRGSRFR